MSKQSSQAPTDKTSADGNPNRGEQRAQGNAGPGAQSSTEADRNSSGNRGGDSNSSGDTRGSSHRGAQPSAEQRNQGGGSDNESARRPQHVGDTTDYGNGNAAPSSANDGGRIDDADNS